MIIEQLAAIGWTGRELARQLDMDERQVRRWIGGATVPPPVAAWLADLAAYHEAHPAPSKPE